MPAISVPRRPFSSELFTGLALPDGIFETRIGTQRINAHFANTSGDAIAGLQLYVESASDPGIRIDPQTYNLASIAQSAERLLAWEADFSAASPGIHRISFIAEFAGTRERIIKKIFVTKVSFDPSTATFSAAFPEGVLGVSIHSFIGPEHACCGKRDNSTTGVGRQHSLLDYIREYARQGDNDFVFCLRQYLIGNVSLSYTPDPAYKGQHSPLPFQDPWWKILLGIIAALLAIGAAIAEAVDGSGSISVSATGGTGGSSGPCCGVTASGGGDSKIAASLLAAAGVVALVAAKSDVRDPFRRGQDNTPPREGEVTIAEHVDAAINYVDTVALGRPFAVDVAWTYTRQTDANTYTFSVSETQHNTHVLSRYETAAPDTVRLYKQELFVVRAKFFDAQDKLMRGGQLFVQCLLCGPNGEFRRIVLQDDAQPDVAGNNGDYTGVYSFVRDVRETPAARGVWTYFVIAQDVNAATPDMLPEEAAQLIGGMVLTHQLSISFSGGACPFAPDGHVNVVG